MGGRREGGGGVGGGGGALKLKLIVIAPVGSEKKIADSSRLISSLYKNLF